ncbi:glycogen debranching protein GlgX [Pendulispora albinea]|uniref:Glycogen debranching protein GlgX n=1 Tax=Pendulispora albinea TaxID=2741071 RepID=A0ABZ2M5H4_9BACT
MSPYPDGATPAPGGTHFALYSESATAVTVCLFGDGDGETGAGLGTERRVPLRERIGHVWHGFVPGVGPGQRYGFRVDGPWDPLRGHRFNPNKLLVDPYARALSGKVSYRGGAIFDRKADGSRDEADSAPFVPKSIVCGAPFDWGDDSPPHTPWRDTVIYEAHVKGLTYLHPEIDPALRGTYLGIASEPMIAHLRALGVTAIELMPVHETCDEPSVAKRGQHNYWGYSTLGYFAPDQRFAARKGEQVQEFQAMVKALHSAGIEVILDVVYNHSCEGDETGPSLFLRGIDNRVYYKLRDHGARTVDFTGCGNSLKVEHPQVLKLICDSLRYWVTEMHVDGFRFDLATTLGREGVDFSSQAAFFRVLHQDPVLSRVKLVSEPWDLGPDGMQLGHFPPKWREWNARFRDGMRRFWNGHDKSLSDLGYRLTGSSDLFHTPGRTPTASINFITAHDGFTLRDLVSYREKHNEANGEEGRDGSNDNASIHFGVEGETDDAMVLAARARQIRNFLAMLFLTPGVPMITSGDEILRTQKGNNNPYVLDDETSWLDWTLDPEAKALRDYVGALARLRKRFPALRRETFFDGNDITWLDVDGHPMQLEDWGAPEVMALSAVMAPAAEDPTTSLCFLLNGDKTEVAFRLPRPRLPHKSGPGAAPLGPIAAGGEAVWRVAVDTRRRDACMDTQANFQAGATYTVPPRCFALLVATNPLGPESGMR